jgi:hypothetical protein
VETPVKALGAICIPKPVNIDELVASIQKVALQSEDAVVR